VRPLVLVIDDEPDLRALLEVILQGSGYDVRLAANGADALSLLEGGLRPSLILVDLMMPGMDGRQFCAAVEDDPRLRGTPVLMITGARPLADGATVPRGAAQVLDKPVSVDVLLATMAELCARSGGEG
jgi:CheY-like chemotaxis protein